MPRLKLTKSAIDGLSTPVPSENHIRQDRQPLGQGLLLDMVLGIVGAVVGGYLFTAIGATGVTGFNLNSIFVSIVGACVVLWAYHALSRR